MIGRKKKTPTQHNLEVRIRTDVARLAKHYGLEEAQRITTQLAVALQDPTSTYRQAVETWKGE